MFKFWKIISISFAGLYLAAIFLSPTFAAPRLANYYLGPLPTDTDALTKLSKMNLLIITPDQAILHRDILSNFKAKNPDMIILAYVPSQSYNIQYWPYDLVFKNMTGIQDSWWLRDSNGNKISSWAGIQNIDINHAWSQYLTGFINQYVVSLPNIDGVFFDMVDGTIAGTNHGDIDLNRDGVADTASVANATWLERMQYLLNYARNHLTSKYIVINGSSENALQSDINGRMFESFPTPWENNGNWAYIFNKIKNAKPKNVLPNIYILNSNTGDSGNWQNYSQMRYGFASSLMVDDTYFSFDHGISSHAQTWWYDEYDVNLGNPAGDASTVSGQPQFSNTVWRREYQNGAVLVNPTQSVQIVDLGGDYEKISGTQDRSVNDGSIIDRVKLQPKDGIILLKTAQTLRGSYFKNGALVRFYHADGTRSRNGFYAFENAFPGGAKIFNGDLNGDNLTDKIVGLNDKVEIFNSAGAHWFEGFPLGWQFASEIYLSVGRLADGSDVKIIASSPKLNRLALLTYYGDPISEKVYPLGKSYRGGFLSTFLNIDQQGSGEVALSAFGGGRPSEILVLDENLYKITSRFYPVDRYYTGYVSVVGGDFNGDGKEELAIAFVSRGKTIVRVFTSAGKKINEFILTGLLAGQQVDLGAAISPVGNKKDIVVISRQ